MLKSKLVIAALSSTLVVGVAAQQEGQTPQQQPAQQQTLQDIEIDRVEVEPGQQQDQKAEDFGPMTAENVLNKLYQASVKEVAFGKLAADKGSNSRVRDFGERLVEDHTAAAKRAKEVARAQNVEIHQLSADDDDDDVKVDEEVEDLAETDLETEVELREGEIAAESMDHKEHAKMAKEKFRVHYQKLHELEDEQFDEEFLAMMEKEHEMLINKLQEAEQQVDNEQVQQLIAQTRPVLTEHQEMAQRIQNELETAQTPDQTQQN